MPESDTKPVQQIHSKFSTRTGCAVTRFRIPDPYNLCNSEKWKHHTVIRENKDAMHHWIETVKPINHSSHAILKFWERVSKAVWNSCKGRTTRQRLQTPAVWAGTAEPLAATARWSLPRFAMFRLLFLHHDVYFTALFHCKQKASFSTSPPLLHSKPKAKQNTKPPSPLNSSLEQLVHSHFLDSFGDGLAATHVTHPIHVSSLFDVPLKR